MNDLNVRVVSKIALTVLAFFIINVVGEEKQGENHVTLDDKLIFQKGKENPFSVLDNLLFPGSIYYGRRTINYDENSVTYREHFTEDIIIVDRLEVEQVDDRVVEYRLTHQKHDSYQDVVEFYDSTFEITEVEAVKLFLKRYVDAEYSVLRNKVGAVIRGIDEDQNTGERRYVSVDTGRVFKIEKVSWKLSEDTLVYRIETITPEQDPTIDDELIIRRTPYHEIDPDIFKKHRENYEKKILERNENGSSELNLDSNSLKKSGIAN
ncbi:MAG: hypothetical protein OXH84_00620 [Gammaproteobacteria bacterium]|nr:hypothetical protein [Gammaproteobacteria bacterium]